MHLKIVPQKSRVVFVVFEINLNHTLQAACLSNSNKTNKPFLHTSLLQGWFQKRIDYLNSVSSSTIKSFPISSPLINLNASSLKR